LSEGCGTTRAVNGSEADRQRRFYDIPASAYLPPKGEDPSLLESYGEFSSQELSDSVRQIPLANLRAAAKRLSDRMVGPAMALFPASGIAIRAGLR
jgi:hypothetical protein